MGTLNKIYYQLKIVKASKDYSCYVSNVPIVKDEYYIHISVDDGPIRVSRLGTHYTPTSVFRVSRSAFANIDIKTILLSTKLFGPDYSETIKGLKREIAVLTETIHVLTKR